MIVPGAKTLGWIWALLVPFVCSCTPWVYWFAIAENAKASDLEGALLYAALLGIGSFLVTGPLAAAQLRLLPHLPLGLRAYVFIYYAISLPTLIFQAVALSSSFLSTFVPGAGLVSNTARTMLLTGLLGAGLYALCAVFMNLAISKIGGRDAPPVPR